MVVRVKICGITTPEAARAASHYGADAVGFVFADSPRRVSLETARHLSEHLSPFVTRVAVFRYPAVGEIQEVLRWLGPDVVQAEPTPEAIDAVAGRCRLLPVLHDTDDLAAQLAAATGKPARAQAVVFEAAGRGGRGVAPDWEHAAELNRSVPVILAGGLDPDNVGNAIARVRPYGVDVSSGVESAPGRKDPDAIAAFMTAVRDAEAAARAAPAGS